MIAYLVRSLIVWVCLMAVCFLVAWFVAPIVAAVIARRR